MMSKDHRESFAVKKSWLPKCLALRLIRERLLTREEGAEKRLEALTEHLEAGEVKDTLLKLTRGVMDMLQSEPYWLPDLLAPAKKGLGEEADEDDDDDEDADDEDSDLVELTYDREASMGVYVLTVDSPPFEPVELEHMRLYVGMTHDHRVRFGWHKQRLSDAKHVALRLAVSPKQCVEALRKVLGEDTMTTLPPSVWGVQAMDKFCLRESPDGDKECTRELAMYVVEAALAASLSNCETRMVFERFKTTETVAAVVPEATDRLDKGELEAMREVLRQTFGPQDLGEVPLSFIGWAPTLQADVKKVDVEFYGGDTSPSKFVSLWVYEHLLFEGRKVGFCGDLFRPSKGARKLDGYIEERAAVQAVLKDVLQFKIHEDFYDHVFDDDDADIAGIIGDMINLDGTIFVIENQSVALLQRQTEEDWTWEQWDASGGGAWKTCSAGNKSGSLRLFRARVKRGGPKDLYLVSTKPLFSIFNLVQRVGHKEVKSLSGQALDLAELLGVKGQRMGTIERALGALRLASKPVDPGAPAARGSLSYGTIAYGLLGRGMVSRPRHQTTSRAMKTYAPAVAYLAAKCRGDAGKEAWFRSLTVEAGNRHPAGETPISQRPYTCPKCKKPGDADAPLRGWNAWYERKMQWLIVCARCKTALETTAIKPPLPLEGNR